jgi:hypothetical protein
MSLSLAIDGVANALAKDAVLLNFKGLIPSSPNDQLAAFIVKSEETDGVIDQTKIPLILLYTRPGRPDSRTSQMYNDKVVIDVFAANSFIARQMVDEIQRVLQNATLSSSGEMASGCRFAYATNFATGLQGVRGHRVYYDVLNYIG